MKAVNVEGVNRVFTHGRQVFHALKNVTFDIEEGEIFGLLGPNGAGKSTLIYILSTLLKPTSGRASIFSYDVVRNRDKVLQFTNAAYGDSELHWALPVVHALDFFGRVYGLSTLERRERIKYLAEIFELGDILEKRFGWLSSGEKRRVILTKALINNPRFLMMDEPTLGLDPDIANKTRKLISNINKKLGTTILLTSHYMHEVEQLCDRIAFIHKGEIIDVEEMDKLKQYRPFSTHIEIRLDGIKDESFIQELGFEISGNRVSKTLISEEELPSIIEALVERKYRILEVKTEGPSLEDYFIGMMSRNEHI